MFSSTTCLTVVFSCGMAPAPYFRRRTVRDHSLLFFTFVLYYIYFILPLLLFVIVCRACPSLIVARPGGGDGFLFRPLRIPFLSWAALESFCYSRSFIPAFVKSWNVLRKLLNVLSCKDSRLVPIDFY